MRGMGRGKIEMKRIVNTTRRQVTYSKRRVGIMKKAEELTVLCDAKVSLIIFSSSGKLAEYCSPSTNAKKILESYQQVTDIDIWNAQYERMQNTLKQLKEVNQNLRMEMGQRRGEDHLEGLDIEELRGLEQNLEESIKIVRQRKYHVISTQTDTCRKKLKNTQEAYRALMHELDIEDENAKWGFGSEDLSSVYESTISMVNGRHHSEVQPNEPNLEGIDYGWHDLCF